MRSAQDAYEFIVFEPQELSNVSADSIAVGETITFDVSGDLTVVDVTRTVTFTVEVTLDSETQISGSAAVNVLRSNFGLTIPDVPSVANVTDDVDLSSAVCGAGGCIDLVNGWKQLQLSKLEDFSTRLACIGRLARFCVLIRGIVSNG